MSGKPTVVCWIAFVLVAVGGLNWGLIGLFDYNVVSSLFGVGSMVTKVIYIFVGVGTLWMIYKAFTCCGKCEK